MYVSVVVFAFGSFEELAQESPAFAVAKLHKKAFDLVGEEDHDAHEFVEYGAYQAHFQDL